MKNLREKRFSLSRIRIGRNHELAGVLLLWVYDLVKFLLAKGILAAQGIDPVMFLFFDMVTVPPFIMGSARLVNSLAGEALAWPRVLGWGGAVLVSTLLPYGYAAWAGKARFTPGAWVLFWWLIVLVLANLARTVYCQVGHQKKENRAGPGQGRAGIRCPGADR